MNKLLMITISLLCLLCPGAVVAAQGTGAVAGADAAPDNGSAQLAAVDPELGLFFEQEDLIVTATKQPQTLKQAPAIATVFTARDIRNMGARDIMDVLKRVPGIGISKNFYGLDEIEARGIIGLRSEKVKLLIDGVSLNELSGGATWALDNLTLDNVKRIEVIRGPGSALYGTDAFLAVINVITKEGKDINGVTLLAGGGSFNTKRYNLQAGRVFNGLGAALSLDYLTTDGDKHRIDSDMFGNSGDTDDFDRRFDAQLRLSYKEFALNTKYIRRNKGVYLGAIPAVNNESEIILEKFFSELSYRRSLLDGRLDLTAKTFVRYLDFQARYELISEGVLPPFPDGMMGMPSQKERDYGIELQFDYRVSDSNLLTIGASYEERKNFDIKRITNFNPLTGAPLGKMTDVSSWANYGLNEDRDVKAVYLQDIWDITDDISLTLGVRHDHYSDFGNTTNPRVALVWEFEEHWDLKLMYATAFRAPSFGELYLVNNPSLLGNPDLNPEKMKTYEVSLGRTDRKGTSVRVSGFYNIFEDNIQATGGPPLQFDNTAGARVWGIETELEKVLFNNGSKMYANYTYQNAEDRETHRELANVAKHKGNVGADITITENFDANLNVFWSGERPRAAGDPRDALAPYTLVDATLIAKNFYKGLELRLSGHNILDEKYEDPSVIAVPGDFPRDGASVMAEATYRF